MFMPMRMMVTHVFLSEGPAYHPAMRQLVVVMVGCWLGCGALPSGLEVGGLPVAPVGGDAGVLDAPRFGRVLVRDTVTRGGHFNDLRGSFGGGDDCVRTRVGGCLVTWCDELSGFAADSVNVGPLTFSGVTFAGSTNPLVLERPPYLESSARPRQLWDGGEPVGVVAPSFDLVAPAATPMTLTPPSCTTTSCLGHLERNQPLAIDWTAGSVGHPVVRVSLERYVITPPATTFALKHVGSFECEYPVDAVRARIATEVLSTLPALSDGGFDVSRIEVARRSTASTATDAGVVTLEVEWVALSDTCTWN